MREPNEKKKQVPLPRTAPFAALGIGLCALILFLCLLPLFKTPYPPFFIALSVLLLGSLAYLFLSRRALFGLSSHDLGHGALEALMKMQFPVVICDKNGKIVWRNRSFGLAASSIDSVMGAKLHELCAFAPEAVEKGSPFAVDFCGRNYEVLPLDFDTDEKHYSLYVFDDKTEYNRLSEAVEDERGVVGYVFMDNLEELSRHSEEDYHNEVGTVAALLREFAASIDALLCEYERSKFLLLMSRGALRTCIESDFDILDRVRDVRIGESKLPLTISIGISDDGETFRQREAAAKDALRTALSRGGDQVFYKSAAGSMSFGGRTRPVQKISTAAAKARSAALVAEISAASAVLIMGHSGADQDCFGASVGMARFARFCGVSPYIIVDKEDRNTAAFIEKFKNLPEYADVFIDVSEAQEMVSTDALLVVVDVNNLSHMLSPDLVDAMEKVVVIDHHRKTEGSKKFTLEYIDPSASSASELVAEFLEQGLSGEMLLHEEAEALLGGILLDTKQFTRSTGTRTLGAAIYLRSAGANIYESAKTLQSDVSVFKKQAEILSDLVIYKQRFAIAKSEEPGEPMDRIAAAKAAESLLTIKDVDAAFVLIRIGEETHVSARSAGAVNVQLILEAMGGGGYLESAGAKSGDPMLDVLQRLKREIDNYLEKEEKRDTED
ncbi:MAG: DHH family phosphoesterase [Clostridia bacterium]|nr:DHH family phosphoesterase [Clostridia bacterium]